MVSVTAMSNLKKIAVWGLGKHAINRIIPSLSKVSGLKLEGICSRNSKTVKEYKKKLNCYGWTDPEDMLKKKDLDIIFIATPIGLHAEQGKRVLLAGKHLWCEKPFTCNFFDSEELIKLSRVKNLVVAEGFMYLYHEQFKKICDIIRTNQIGHIKEVNLKFGFPRLENPGFRYNLYLGGGAFWDVGSYCISAALHLFENEIVNVKYANIKNSKDYKVDFDGTVILEFARGSTVICSWYIGVGYKNEIDLWGEDGSLYSDKIFSKIDGYNPKLRFRDKYGVETIDTLRPDNQFVQMFKKFLYMLKSNDEAEKERENIIRRARLMDYIATNYSKN